MPPRGPRLPGMNRAIPLLSTAALTLAAMGAVLVHEAAAAPPGAPSEAAAPTREIEIFVDGAFDPGRVTVREGERVRLRFLRRDPSPCAGEVVLAALGIRRALPLDEPVIVELPPLPAGEVELRCGMNMLRGRLVVLSREG